MNILNLFDGIGCGRIALEKLGIKYFNYYASEIDKYCLKVAKHNYPDINQLGDIKNIKATDLPQIDLIMGGSPCQGFSFSGKRLNFDDPRSKLFFEFVRLIDECKPKYWFMENVVMRKDFEAIITEYLQVKPVLINSSLVSAQNRQRLYWANFEITQPEDKKIKLIDILETNDKYYLNKASIIGRRLNEKGIREDNNKNLPISQCLEVRDVNTEKSNCLTTIEKDNVLTTLPIGRYKDVYKCSLPYRYYTLKECCRLQTVPENYFSEIVTDGQAKKMLGNAWTVDVIVHILKHIIK